MGDIWYTRKTRVKRYRILTSAIDSYARWLRNYQVVDHCVSQEFLAAARTVSRAVLPPLQFKWLRQCLECDPPVPGVGLGSIPTQGLLRQVQLWRRIIFRLMELVRSPGSWFIYSRPSGPAAGLTPRGSIYSDKGGPAVSDCKQGAE